MDENGAGPVVARLSRPLTARRGVDETGTEIRLAPLADRAGRAEAHAACRRGDALGQGWLALAERALGRVPLVDNTAQG